jgi:hypothetical protein
MCPLIVAAFQIQLPKPGSRLPAPIADINALRIQRIAKRLRRLVLLLLEFIGVLKTCAL